MEPILRIHLPEWRDSHAVTQQVALSLSRGVGKVHLTGARGDRLLLAGLSGTWTADIRIDGDLGTELARNMNAPGVFVLANGAAGAGAGSGMKAGTLVITGKAGPLLGTQLAGGEIWALAGAGARLAYRAEGGLIVASSGVGPMAMDRRRSGTLTFRSFPHPADDAQAMLARIEAIRAWPVGQQ